MSNTFTVLATRFGFTARDVAGMTPAQTMMYLAPEGGDSFEAKRARGAIREISVSEAQARGLIKK